MRLSAYKNKLTEDNGNNKYCIVLKCKYEVYDTEWEELATLINNTIEEYDNGRLSNIKTYLEEI